MAKKRLYIDVREPEEFQSGHVNGAVNLPCSILISGRTPLNHIDKEAELIVYCRSGKRSSFAIQILKQMGYSSVINGINADYVNNNYLT